MGPYGYATGALPPPGQPFRDPFPQDQRSPSKAYFFGLNRQQQDTVRAAHDAMNQAIKQLLSVGIMPRWIVESANRFTAQAMNLAEPPVMTVWDADQPSASAPNEPGMQFWAWDGERWTYNPPAPHAAGWY